MRKSPFDPLLRALPGLRALHRAIALLNCLRVALAAATQAESARKALNEKLNEERQQFDFLRSELRVLSRGWSVNALDWYLEQLHATQQALQGTRPGYANNSRCWRLRPSVLLDAWREWTGRFLQNELGDVSSAQQKMFCEPLHKAQAHLTRTLRAFQDRLAEHVKSTLGVPLTPHEFVLEVRGPTAPPVDVSYAFDAAFSRVGWLIPTTLFRKAIEGRHQRRGNFMRPIAEQTRQSDPKNSSIQPANLVRLAAWRCDGGVGCQSRVELVRFCIVRQPLRCDLG